tara:strand:+ start:473420 stop:477448 length:4029 start_codon:yes stop_codon:yes gene_type:complete
LGKVNRILILFFTILAFTLGGVIHLIQTEKFASIVTQRIKKKAKRDFGVELKFSRVEVKMFPPATLLKEVELEKVDSKFGLKIFSEEIGLYFSLFDFFSRRFQVDTVKFNSTEVEVEIEDSKEKSKLTYPKLFFEYKKFRRESKVLVKNLEFVNLDLSMGEHEVDVGLLKLSLFKNIILTSGNVKQVLSPLLESRDKDFHIDSLDYLLHLKDEEVDIKEITISSGLDIISAEGTVDFGDNKPELDLVLNSKTGIRSIATKLGYKKEIREYPVDGVASVNIVAQGSFEDPKIKVDAQFDLIDSEYAQVEKINISLDKKENEIWVRELEATQNGGVVKLKEPLPVLDFKLKKFLSHEGNFIADNIHTNDALYILRDYLDVIKGNISGELKIGWNKAGVYFLPKKGFKITDFKLYTDDYKDKILENAGFSIERANMLLTYDLVFKFKAELDIGDSKAQGEGRFSSEEMKVVIYESLINLEDIGPIVGLPIIGSGKLRGFIGGKYDDVNFTFLPDLANFEILDFKLGNISGKVDFNLPNLTLKVEDAKGRYGSTRYEGAANFYFEKDFFDLDINVPTGNYADAEKMIPTVISLLSKKPLEVDFNFDGNIKYESKFDTSKMKLSSSARGENINFYSERFDSFNADVALENDNFKVKSFSVMKNQGQLQLKGNYELDKDRFKYNGNLSGLGLRDYDAYNTLNLGLNGKVRGEFYGEGLLNNFTSRAQFRLENSEIGNRKLKDSIFTIYNKGSDVFLSANLFEGVSISEGYISVDKKLKRKSYFNTRIFTDNPSLLAGVLSEHNYINQNLEGRLDIRSELSFHIGDYENFDLDFVISELDLNFQGEKIQVDKNKNKLKVEKGKMKNWDLRIDTTKKGFFHSYGSGDVSRSFQINSKYKANPIFFKLITPKLLSAVGEISGNSILFRENENFSFHSESIGKNIDVKLDKVPGALRNIEFKLISEGKDVLLEKFEGQYGKGSISADGNVRLKFPFPEVNLNGSINGAQVAVTDKTFVVVSGNASLKGKQLPYLLSGGVSVLHGEVLNEFEDFSKLMGLSEGYLRYIPNKGRLSKLDVLNYDLDFDIFNPVSVKNSIADLKLDGSLKVIGPMTKPLINGDLNILPNVSRVFFKGNEFIMTEGRLSFLDVNKKEVPEIKLAGIASVDRYEVGLAVDGKIDKFGIKLSSNPSLDQSQILSLLVLGVPDDINQELDDAEREQIAVQGGVGLIVERFKLVKPIDSMLGLKFSVSPEFQEDESSLLDGRLSGGDSGASRYKSGTKIKVQKKNIIKKVDVSFSSTVGGTVEETKEMNVNYNINKNLSLEGVYELRSVEEETEENPESLGADLKWKFSF